MDFGLSRIVLDLKTSETRPNAGVILNLSHQVRFMAKKIHKYLVLALTVKVAMRYLRLHVNLPGTILSSARTVR